MLSSVKSFVISFIVALLVFGALGYYAYPYVKSVSDGFLRPGSADDENTTVDTGIAAPDTLETDESGTPPDPTNDFEGQQSFTLLLFGSDYQPDVFSDYRVTVSTSSDIDVLASHQRHYTADVITLVRYSAELGTVIFSAIPSNMTVTAGGINMSLGEVLEKKNVTYFIGMIESVTGLTVDYYVYSQIALFKDIVDMLGGVKFDVPVDMKYTNDEERIVEPGASRDPIITGYDKNGDPITVPPGKAFKIDLNKGIQTLNGEKASWVLRYNAYNNGKPDYVRYRDTQVNFFKVMFEQVMREEFRARLSLVISEINKRGSTNITPQEFEEISTTLLNYPAYEKATVPFPGNNLNIGGVQTFSYSRSEAYKTYDKYKLK